MELYTITATTVSEANDSYGVPNMNAETTN